MPEQPINPTPTQPMQPQQPQAKPNPLPKPPQPHMQSTKSAITWLSLLMFIIGLIGGILLYATYPKILKPVTPETINYDEVTLPKDAAKIHDCVPGKGTLFMRPQDTPRGPVYMVYKNKVIGLEYKIDPQEFINGKTYNNLNTFNATVNHLNAGSDQSGFIDLYFNDADTEKNITCPTQQPSPSPSTSPDLSLTPTSTTSSSPSPSENPISSDWKVYTNSKLKISFNYPQNLSISENKDGKIFVNQADFVLFTISSNKTEVKPCASGPNKATANPCYTTTYTTTEDHKIKLLDGQVVKDISIIHDGTDRSERLIQTINKPVLEIEQKRGVAYDEINMNLFKKILSTFQFTN